MATTFVRSRSRLLVVAVGGILAQLALIAAFTGAMARPHLRDADVAVVGAEPAVAAIADHPVSGLAYVTYSSSASAVRAVRDGDLPAALVLDGSRARLIVAGASGPSLVAAITTAVATQTRSADLPLTTVDVRPLPANDPRGLGTFLLVIGWVIGGYLGMTLLTRALGAASRTLRGTVELAGWAAIYSMVSAMLGVVLVDPVMGVVTGAPLRLALAGSLIVFSVATFTAAMLSLAGVAGLIMAVATLVILGNPTSGGSTPPEMLAPGWRFLARILPPNAGVSLVRSIQYFGDHQLTRPLIVLLGYAVASVVVMLFVSAERERRGSTGVTTPAVSMAGAAT